MTSYVNVSSETLSPFLLNTKLSTRASRSI